MSTSGTSQLTMTRDTIVRRALRMVGAYTSPDLPRPEQLTDAITVLNMMLKTWQVEGFLWLRRFETLPLVADQRVYSLGPSGSLSIDRPLHIYNATRKDSSGYEVPLISLTRSDYMAIPNKYSSGVPVQFYYDPLTDAGNFYIWPVPSTGMTYSIVLDCDRSLDIMTDSLNDYDFPPQWYDALTYGLAVRLAPEYGLPLTERQMLETEYNALFNRIVTDDRDVASIRFGVQRP